MNEQHAASHPGPLHAGTIGCAERRNTSSLLSRSIRFVLAIYLGSAFLVLDAEAQPRRDAAPRPVVREAMVALPGDVSNCPDCSAEEITLLSEVTTKYQGMKGTNPSAPSSYNLIGKHKFSGTGFSLTNSFWGENWYPIRTEKQILTGLFHDFGVANYGDESDWNIHILPDPGFEGLIADAIPYQRDNWYASGDWPTTADGKFLIEAEITPDERRYGNPWFTTSEKKSPLVGKKLSAYGPFVREEAHGNHPEIHPCEQLWWREGNDVLMVLLLVDDSNRFKERADTVRIIGGQLQVDPGDFSARRVTTFAYQPWALETRQEAELSIAFEVDPTKGGIYMSVQALDDLNFYSGASYPDDSNADKNTVSYRGNVVLTVQEGAGIDPYVGVTFRNVCFNRAKGTLQGYVVLNTAIGNGKGKEGFVALHIERKSVGLNTRPTILAGDLINTWKAHAVYDDQVAFTDIISSDMYGKGIVNGLMDFNGNGKTDFFAKKGDRWMVLYDGRGTWQELNTSSISVNELRFGDVDGDRKTDILRVGPRKKVQVSYGGTGQWTEITDAGEQNQMIQVGDFNGDGKTDIVYLKYIIQPAAPLRADMYVKYGCTGSWKKLNNNYNLGATDDYVKNFRFGNFNGDKITDIFRYNKKRFGVYWNGTGDFKELCTPGFDLKTDDLLFIDNETSTGLTDVIYVDRISKKWTVFYGGKPGSLPLTIKYNDPASVRFGDLDPDPAVEPFAVDFVEQRISPLDVAMTFVAKAESEPSVMPRYVPGSLKRVQSGGSPSLTVSMNLQRYQGSGGTARRRDDLQNVTGVKERIGSKTLRFKSVAASEAQPDEGQTIGTIEGVPLAGRVENHVQLTFATRSVPESYNIPAYAITGVPNATEEITGASGNWNSWKTFLSATVKPEKAPLLTSAPALPTLVKTVKFEVLPFYSSLEERKVRLVEMDDMTKEMNDVAYGTDRTRINEIFGDGKIFTITWKFELKNMTTGQTMSIASPNSLASDGKWPKNKVSFRFPQQADLLQFKALATIKDPLGNSTVEPLEFAFWNQRINLTESDKQIPDWLKPLESTAGYQLLLTKAQYLGEDSVLTPEELGSLVR